MAKPDLVSSYTTTGYPGHVIRHPHEWPEFIVQRLWMKSAYNAYNIDNAAAFWTKCNIVGAWDNYGAGDADTWQSVVTVSGSGFIGNIIGPCSEMTGVDAINRIRLTLDGEDWYWEFTVLSTESNEYRAVLGTTIPWGSTGATGSDYTYAMSNYDRGFCYGGFGTGSTVGTQGFDSWRFVVPPQMLLSHGLPVLRYEEGFQVRYKTTRYNATYPYLSACAVLYMEDHV